MSIHPKNSSSSTSTVNVDVLVVGSGGGGMTAAMAAKVAGLDTLLIEKDDRFGGTTALSGGGMWVPGARVQVDAGHRTDPEAVIEYLKTITAGVVSEAKLRAYVETAPLMLDFVQHYTDIQLTWKPGYSDYFPEVPGGSAKGSVINVEPIDLRRLGADAEKLLRPPAIGPRGMWLRPLELKTFYTIRQSWKGKAILLRFLWRSLRSRLTGEQVVTMGQALAAHLWLGLRRLGVTVWLDSPLQSLITGPDGTVTGAVVRHEGADVRVEAPGGVILATGGFEHNPEMRSRYQPFVPEDYSLGTPTNTGDGIRAGEAVGGAIAQMEGAWWFPTLAWPDGRLHVMLNERMLPAQFIVNGAGERFINEATPYTEFGQAMIKGEATGTTPYMPCWLIIDAHTWKHYVFAGHLPLPHIPLAPVPTGAKMVDAWAKVGIVKQGRSWAELAAAINVPPARLEGTARRFNQLAASGHDDDFGRGDSAYDRYYGDDTLPNPNLAPLGDPPYYAFKVVLGDLGTNGGLKTDEDARVLRGDGSAIGGLYATGNVSAVVMGGTYAGAGSTIGPAMTFGFRAANHVAAQLAKSPQRARASSPG